MPPILRIKDENGNWHVVPAIRGTDGVSPVVSMERQSDGVAITVTDVNGTKTEKVYDGVGSGSGGAGFTFTPSVSENGDLSWTNNGGLENPATVNIKGPQGEDGNPGISATHSWEGTVLTVTSASGTSSADLKGPQGDPGAAGSNGSDGVGIESVEQTTSTTADGGDNVITVTLTNGTQSTITLKNGSKGEPGTAGADGSDGNDGYTPVKGTDYYTDADKEEMVQAVLAALPEWTGGSY